MKKLTALFLTILTLLMLLGGCRGQGNAGDGGTAEKDPVQVDELVFAMDTAMTLRAYGDNAKAAVAACKDEILRLDELFSTTADGGDIRRINEAGGEFVEVDAETLAVLRLALDCAALTNGCFDPTIYPVVRLYGFTTDSFRVAGDAEIAAALETVDYANIEIDGSRVRTLNGAKIDLGGIAKGYLANRLKSIMEEHGVASAILSLGGNIISVGNKPDGSVWNIGITDPNEPATECLALPTDRSVVTSGSYQRYFIGDDGALYHHIIDPATGRPANNGLLSVSVVCEDSAKADALSTALFVLGFEAAAEFWRENGGFDIVFIDNTNTIYATPGVYADLRPLVDGYEIKQLI